VTLEADYGAAAREMLASHLASSGLKARVGRDGVATGIGRIVVDFEVENVVVEGDIARVVFWARIDGIAGVPSRIDLDLLGLGHDAHEALEEGVHAVLDGVVPVLRLDHDGGEPHGGVVVLKLTSMTDGRATPWALVLGPPAVGDGQRDELLRALEDSLLMQGIVDSITPVLGEIRPHWMKLFLVRSPDGRLLGDVKIDGLQVGVADSFDSAAWPASSGGFIVRQFGLARPSNRAVDADTLATLGGGAHERERGRSWWRRPGR
jgi:hypothetical protein